MPPEKRDWEAGSARHFRLVEGRSAEGVLLSRIASGSIAEIVIAVAAVLAVCYAGKLPLITLFLAILIASVLAPIADRLERRHLPRWASSFVAVSIFLVSLYGVAYFSYNKAMEFLDELPQYSQNIS